MQQPPHRKTPDIAECAEEKNNCYIWGKLGSFSFATLKIHAPQGVFESTMGVQATSPRYKAWPLICDVTTSRDKSSIAYGASLMHFFEYFLL
ncbi:hypothetical protein TNCV_2403421 [Trichonephila clavipes]|uniref:Uncharacterized protein n=1 Tax=Trichonephila clavipes TaxID=2585209 RepID=A0A8X6R664_TRICX|nr:hypothetical protein TNCV_2403421 [Trichonephila clavipes]